MRYNVTEAEFHHFRMEGCGMIFAHLNNRLHTADCETLQYQANAYKKRLFDDLEEATSWLNSHRPGWQNCPVCYHLRDRHRRAEVGKRRGTRGRTSGAHAGSQPQTELERAYATLHLIPGAPLVVAEGAYRAVIKLAHPDKGGSHEGALKLTWAISVIRKHFNAA